MGELRVCPVISLGEVVQTRVVNVVGGGGEGRRRLRAEGRLNKKTVKGARYVLVNGGLASPWRRRSMWRDRPGAA